MAIDPRSAHYDAGGIEAHVVMRAKLTDEQMKGFLLGNILKYALRANHKGTFYRDVEKIAVYARMLMELEDTPR